MCNSPSRFNYFSKTLAPNTITWGINNSIYEFQEVGLSADELREVRGRRKMGPLTYKGEALHGRADAADPGEAFSHLPQDLGCGREEDRRRQRERTTHS